MNNIGIIIFGCTISYLIGAIPFGYILGKLFGVGDIRKIGSGTIGATNMLRTGKRGLAGATLLLDIVKGLFATSLINVFYLYVFWTVYEWTLPMPVDYSFKLVGLAAIIGHIFPIWLNFKGGKGVATALGTLLCFNPMAAFLIIIVWLITFFISRISSLSALVGFTVACLVGLLPIWKQIYFAQIDIYYMWVITAIIFATHKDNIIRLIQGKEHKWKAANEPS